MLQHTNLRVTLIAHLFKRSTYFGVVDTGPVPGETFEQKVARLAKVAAAAKQRSEGG